MMATELNRAGADRAASAAGFLTSILADPAEDTVRLAFADWLDENGQPARAAFIREQVANPTAQVAVDPGCVLTYAGKTLFCAPGDERDDDGLVIMRAAWVRFIFRRGFPDELVLPNFYTNGADEVQAFPITKMSVRGVTPLRASRRGRSWAWQRASAEGGMLPHEIPQRLFDKLEGGKPAPVESLRWRDSASAVAALSAVLLARAKAGGA